MFKKIYIEITNICNLSCKFCPKTHRRKQFMNILNFEEVIKKVYNHTNLICLHVKGEPLLHPDLDKILQIINKYGLKVNITTNGTLIKENIHLIKNIDSIRQINFSIHSFTQNNMLDKEYLYNIFKSTEELKNTIVSYRLWNITNLQESLINKEIIKEIEEYYNLEKLEEELKLKSFFKIRDNLFINLDKQFTWPDINGNVVIEKGRCLALKEQIGILVDGSVIPCCLDNNGDISLGNIFDESLEDIINSKKAIIIRKNFENNVISCKLCKTCGFLKNLEEKRLRKYNNFINN